MRVHSPTKPFNLRLGQGRGLSESLRSYSALKLLQLESRYGFLRDARVVVDLGSFPGGWSQVSMSKMNQRNDFAEISNRKRYAAQSFTRSDVDSVQDPSERKRSDSSAVIAVDVLLTPPIPGVTVVQGNFLDPHVQNHMRTLIPQDPTGNRYVDVLLSDMGSGLSGNQLRDSQNSVNLCSAVVQFARDHLRPYDGVREGGSLILKHFVHPLLSGFRKRELDPIFKRVCFIKPGKYAQELRVGYWLCRDFMGGSYVPPQTDSTNRKVLKIRQRMNARQRKKTSRGSHISMARSMSEHRLQADDITLSLLMFKTSKGGFASKIAHTSLIPLGNQDLRPLQELINHEKNVLTSLHKLSTDFTKASDSLKTFGVSEDDDLNDVLSCAAEIMGHVSAALVQFAHHELEVRQFMKDIRTREESLHELRQRRKAVGAKAQAAENKLSKMSGEHKNLPQQTELLNQLRDEMRALDMEILSDEATLGDRKRYASKAFLALKFGGLLEFAEKATIVGEIGKVLIDEIPQGRTLPGQQRAPYQGYAKTKQLVQEVQRCVAEVVFTATGDPNNPSLTAPMGRASEDSANGPVMPSQDRFNTVNSNRTDNSDYPSMSQSVTRPSEFGEDGQTLPSDAPAPSSSSHYASRANGPAPFAALPPGHSKRTDRNVSFSQSVQDALNGSPSLASIDVSSGPPLTLSSDAQSPTSPKREEESQRNPWDEQQSNDDKRSSWVLLPEEDRAKNQAAAREIGMSIFAPPEPSLQRMASVPPPPPIPAAMPALRTPSPSVMPLPLPPASYAPPSETTFAPPAHPPPQAMSYAPPSGPPPPPSMYGTPAHSFSGDPSASPGSGRITAAAFKRAQGLRQSSTSSTDLRRGLPASPRSGGDIGVQGSPALGPVPTRQGTLPPYEPRTHEPRAYAEDAYNTGSPTDADYGALGPTRIHNSDAGYAEGRFATNLER